MNMHSCACYLVSLVAFSMLWFLLQASVITANFSIGVILDQTSRPGKEAKVAIEIAIQDFNIKIQNQSDNWSISSKLSKQTPSCNYCR